MKKTTMPGKSIKARLSVRRFGWEVGTISFREEIDRLVFGFFESSRVVAPGKTELGLARKGIKRFRRFMRLDEWERKAFLAAWDKRRQMDRYFVNVGKRRKAHRRRRKA